MIDLHMHSTASDGTDEPAELVRQCAELGLDLCSITDHDNVDAQRTALEQSRTRRLPYITGVELSVQYTGELHILGYGFDLDDAHFRAEMEELRSYRVGRTLEIIERLREVGLDITLGDVQRHAGGNTLGRPHVALALLEKGCVRTYWEAFHKYLNEGGLCYVGRRRLGIQEGIDLILSAGGTPVLAHPGLIKTDDLPGLVRALKDRGLEGIEAFYPSHSDRVVETCLAAADELGLLVTCGCDYHGASRENRIGCERRHAPILFESAERLKDKYLRSSTSREPRG